MRVAPADRFEVIHSSWKASLASHKISTCCWFKYACSSTVGWNCIMLYGRIISSACSASVITQPPITLFANWSTYWPTGCSHCPTGRSINPLTNNAKYWPTHKLRSWSERQGLSSAPKKLTSMPWESLIYNLVSLSCLSYFFWSKSSFLFHGIPLHAGSRKRDTAQ